MGLIIRQKGSRRWRLPVEFPLKDCQGVLVIQDRRRLPNRRKAKFELEDMKVISAKMVGN